MYMYVYVCIYMYVCIYTCIFFMYIYMYIYMYIFLRSRSTNREIQPRSDDKSRSFVTNESSLSTMTKRIVNNRW